MRKLSFRVELRLIVHDHVLPNMTLVFLLVIAKTDEITYN